MMESSNQTSKNLVVLITGYQGLARQLTSAFADSGHTPCVLIRKESEIASFQEAFPKAHVFCGDVKDSKTTSAWIEGVLEKFGKIDVLINNAAIQGPGGLFHELPWNDVEDTIQTDLFAPLRLVQKLVPIFLGRGSGVIINLSGGGATAARPRFLPYAISKCALVRATETLSEEYPELYFFAVAPGTLKTQMTESILKMGENIAGTEFASLQKKILAGGDGTEKAAELIRWLCCERPSHLKGKLISAIWDNYKDIDPKDVSADQWTLRRVDAVLTNKLMNP